MSSYPIVQLIDLDAAMRQGDNAALIEKIAKRLPCQVGGGIRTAEHAKKLLEAGARRVILGSALFGAAGVETKTAETLDETAIGREQFVASIDTKGGRIAVRGLERERGIDAGAGHLRRSIHIAGPFSTHMWIQKGRCRVFHLSGRGRCAV